MHWTDEWFESLRRLYFRVRDREVMKREQLLIAMRIAANVFEATHTRLLEAGRATTLVSSDESHRLTLDGEELSVRLAKERQAIEISRSGELIHVLRVTRHTITDDRGHRLLTPEAWFRSLVHELAERGSRQLVH